MTKAVSIPDKTHVNRTCCAEIQSIAEPMSELFGINSMTYQCVYHNGTLIALTSHSEWNEYYWEHKCHQHVDGIPYVGFRKIIIDPYVAPESPYWQYVVKPAQDLFDLHHAVIFLKFHITHTELFIFTFPKENQMYESMAHNYVELVNKYMFFFKEKAHKLIEEHKQHPLLWAVKPGTKVTYSVDKNFLSQNKITKYLSKISSHRFYLGGSYENTYLTSRELDCLRLLSKQCTAKEIGNELKVSSRTAEKYINILKEKLYCDSKKQLVEISHKIINDHDFNHEQSKQFIDDKVKADPKFREQLKQILGCDLDDIDVY